MTNNLDVGMSAPDFKVAISDEKIVSKNDFIGQKLVIYFYPKDNTSGCTSEAKDFAELYDKFKSKNVEILGVSKDSLKSHKNFSEKYNLPFMLGADVEMEMCKSFGVWVEKSMYGKKYMGIERSTFLISETGSILKVWRKVKVKDHAAEILDEVK